MREVTALYKTLRKQPDSYYEVEVVQGQNTYSTDRLVSVKTYPALFESSGPQIGVCHSTICELSVIESSKNWPRMAQFTVRVRLSSADNTQKSEWLLMGTYYTDERSEDAYGNLSIIAYDRMLMTEQYWTDKIREQDLPSSWPVTSKAWADMMVNAGLIEIDSRTVLDDTVPIIGLNTASTIRDNLRTIAAAHGSNWQVTPDGKLRLIPFVNIVDGQAAIAGIAIAGISIVGDGVIESAEGIDYAFLGMNVQSFDSSPALDRITGVNLETEAGNVAAAGTTAGYVLSASCEFANSTGLGDLCLSKLQGYVYKPFSAGNALLDPAAEVGDIVIINGRSYQMMSIDWNISTWPTANIGAAYDQEVDHEYTILAPEAKTYRKAMAATDDKLMLYPTTLQMQSAISQTEEAIELSVSQTYVTINDYDTTIQDLRDQIAGTITQFSGDPIPTLNNYPANEWTTAAERKQHVGALYLVTAGEERGQYYRFEQSGSTFGWVLVEDSALATALARAAEAQAAAEQAIADAETAQQAADAAQGTADQARLDAVARAAEAQAAAITQAAIDATNKANQALQDAKDYATGEVERFVFGEYAEDMNAIHDQIDQKVESYYQSEDPSTDWEAPEEHTGDLWYNTNDQKYYRWSGTEWLELTANPPRAVFDVLDGKAQVFIAQPVPPYYEGDLWAQGATGDILRCVYEKHEGQLFDSADWELASKYTDNSTLLAFINGEYAEMVNSLKQQLDQKAETYYQADDPSKAGNKSRWQAIAGIAVAGVTIIGGTNETHTGDMWYRTTDDTTWYWNGTNWVQQNIPKEMFDFIDGKAQIFVNQPITPYQVGDLWFNSETSDIMTCIRDRSEGSFTASDWQKRNKYTDDTKANAVEADLNEYKTVTNATLDVHSNRIDAKVETTYGRDGQTATKSFSWELTDSAHRWFANNNKKVMEVTASGLSVEGQITATSGYIGNGSNGFTISASSIHNGMTSFNDTTHDGVYIGTDGISLGGGKFKVDQYGNLTAATGTFSGSVYASNIKSTAVDGVGGYFSGLGIEGSSLTTGQFSGGVNQSLGYANDYNAATVNGANGPNYFTCGTLTARSGVTTPGNVIATGAVDGGQIRSGTYKIRYGPSGAETEYNMGIHTHQISADTAGKVTIGAADWTGAAHSFNIADTKFYKDAVSAVTVTSVTPNGRATSGDFSASFNSTDTLRTPYYSSGYLYGNVKLIKGNDSTNFNTLAVSMDASAAITAGKTELWSATAISISGAKGTDGTTGTITATASATGQTSKTATYGIGLSKTTTGTGYNSTTHKYSINVAAKHGNTVLAEYPVTTGTEAFEAGAASKAVTDILTYGSITYKSKAMGGDPTYTVPVRASFNDGTYSEVDSIDVNGSSAFNEGAANKAVSSITTYGAISYKSKADGGNPTYTVPLRANHVDGTQSDTKTVDINASSAYSEGVTAGAASAPSLVGVQENGNSTSGDYGAYFYYHTTDPLKKPLYYGGYLYGNVLLNFSDSTKNKTLVVALDGSEAWLNGLGAPQIWGKLPTGSFNRNYATYNPNNGSVTVYTRYNDTTIEEHALGLYNVPSPASVSVGTHSTPRAGQYGTKQLDVYVTVYSGLGINMGTFSGTVSWYEG